MVQTKYINKYHVICDRDDYQCNKKHKSLKSIIKDLKDSPISISRSSIYKLTRNQNKNYKYHGLKILIINEIIPTKIIRIMIDDTQLDNATATRPTLEEVETIQEVTS